MFEGIKDRFKDYIDTKLQIYQLTIEEKMVDFVTILFYVIILFGLFLVTFCFILLFLAKIINYAANNQFLGYGIVASLCLFLLWLLAQSKTREQITIKIKKQILLNIKK